MMKTITLKLNGPMQSYGNVAYFSTRSTLRFPTKSAVIGLISSALGYDRTDEKRIQELNSLKFAVRIDMPGKERSDYQIMHRPLEKSDKTINRKYLADALFLVALSGPENLINKIVWAIEHPVYQSFLGRKAYLPAGPIIVKKFNHDDALHVLKKVPWQAPAWFQKQYQKTTFSAVIIADAELNRQKEPFLLHDKVESFNSDNRYFSGRLTIQENVILINDWTSKPENKDYFDEV